MRLSRLLVLSAAAVLAACDSSSTTAPPVSVGVGPAGGNVSSSNNAATVVIPPGALGATTAVTVASATGTPANPALVSSAAFDFGPSGTTFASPVTISITYDPATLPANVAESSLQLYTVTNGAWTVVSGSTVNTTTHMVTGQTSHFSPYAPVGVVVIPVATVTVTPAAPTVTIGSGVQLTAVTKDAGSNTLNGRVVTWSTSAPSIATVNASGVVTGVSAGTATITATSETKTGSVTVTVTPKPVASVVISSAVTNLAVGDTARLTATTSDNGGVTLPGRVVTWASSDPTKATISSTGLVTAVAVGSTTITATSEGINGTGTVNVAAAQGGGGNLTQALVAIAAGDNHACGLSSTGAAYCWGAGGNGLGDGTSADRLTATAVLGGLTFASIAADINLSCGVTTGGALYCWGGGSQLTIATSPAAVAPGLTFASVSAANSHICGVTTAGVGYCEGSNTGGILGTGQSQAALPLSTTFLQVAGGLSWKQIVVRSGGSCGITVAGALYCWGNIAGLNTGVGAVASSATPVLITNAVAFASLAPRMNSYQVCGLLASGAATCIGQILEEFGGTTGATVQTPSRVGGTLTFTSLAHYNDTMCGVATSGSLYCWGNNGRGELGQGPSGPGSSVTPLVVKAGTNFASVTVGDEGSVCGITTAGVGYCWGYNFYGQIGDGTKVDKSVPTAIGGGVTFRAP